MTTTIEFTAALKSVRFDADGEATVTLTVPLEEQANAFKMAALVQTTFQVTVEPT